MNKQEIEKAIHTLECARLYIFENSNRQDYSLEALDRLSNAVDDAKSALEQQLTNGWIPDRLPPEPSKEDAEPMSYLVTLNEYAIKPMQLYYIGKGRWVREYDEPCHVYENVIAWRPEPKIYKEVSYE